MKKTISFILILLLVSAAAWVAFGTLILEFLAPADAGGAVNTVIAQDAYGNIYLISQEDGSYALASFDTNGNMLLNQPLSLDGVEGKYYVDDLYIASNRNIYITVYTAGDEAEQLTSLSMHKLYENGSYAKPVMELIDERPYYGQGRGAVFSKPVEDELYIYFGAYTNGRIKTYRISKGDMEAEIELLRDAACEYAPAHILALPDQRIFYATGDGALFLYEAGKATPPKQVSMPLHVVAGEIFAGASGDIIYRDIRSGDLISYAGGIGVVEYDANLRLHEDGAKLGAARLAHVNQQGRISGVVFAGGGDWIFTGTRQYMNTFLSARAATTDDMLRFLVPAVAVGVVLLTILLWDFFCRILKMRLSIRLRQGLLILAVVAVLMYSLSNYIVTPMLGSALKNQYASRMETAAKSLDGALLGMDASAVPTALVQAGKAQDADEPLHFDIFDAQGALLASSDGYAQGTSMDLMPQRMAISKASAPLKAGEGVFYTAYEDIGLRGYYVLRTAQGGILSASAGMSMIEHEIVSVNRTVDIFLMSMGGALVVALFVIESITARNIRRLKKGVDAVGAGDYTVFTHIGSGDEVEDLANSFNSMTALVRNNLEKMKAINSAYYRFVPESMARLLGAKSIGELKRGSCVKERVTILVVRFSLLDGVSKLTTEELFTRINDAMQAFTRAVPENGGTVYDMSSEGFRAVFESGSEDGLRAALHIRNQASAYNGQREQEGQGRVDVRMALSHGDVMLGLVGDDMRLSPTAISDCIRDAEEALALLNKSEVYICCTEEALHGVRGSYRNRFLGVIETSSGKALRLYDFFDGDPFALVKQKEMCKERFLQATTAFYSRDYEKAKTLFLEIVRLSPGDSASVQYMYFSDSFIKNPPKQPFYKVID